MSRRAAVIRALLPLLALLAFSSCASLPPAAPAVPPAQESRVVIFHFNDVHGKIDGFPKVAALIDAERRRGSDVLVFCAGDNFTGNPVIDQYDPPGRPMLELLNRLGVDLMTPGNHEFDVGMENLRRFAAQARFPFVSANIRPRPGNEIPNLYASRLLTTKSGVRIAVFGLIQIEPGNGLPSTHPDRVQGLRFSEPLATALEMKPLRRNADAFLALTHIGYEEDVKLAASMPELDAIIGGHSHTRVAPAETVNGVLVAQAGSDLRWLGRVELLVRGGRVAAKKGELIDVKGLAAEDPEVKAMVARFNDNPAFARVIATAPFAIEGKDALGSMMTDAMRAVHGLDVAFQNEGGIRLRRLDPAITLKDVYTLDPFGNQVVEIAMNAGEIRSLLRDSFEKGRELDLQVSGLSYTIRTDKELRSLGIDLRGLDGRPLAEDRDYKVGVSSYVASSYRFAHRDPGRSLNATTAEALIRYLQDGADLSLYRDIQRAFQDPPGRNDRY